MAGAWKEKPITLILITTSFFRMNLSRNSGLITCVFLILAMVVVLPVSAVVASANTAAPAGTPAASSVAAKPMISATVSAATPIAGDPVTVSGVATGGNAVNSVQIWIFAGSYVNVSTVTVNADGTYSKTYQTAGFPPATYYVYVQSPGNDGKFGIALDQSGKYSGQIVDVKDGSLLVNMTGTGSVQDAAAAVALTDSLNKRGGDDVYTKTTFQLMAPTTATPAAASSTVPAVPATTAKSSLSPLTLVAGLGLCGAVFRLSQK
jgi:hypothetical protein